MMIFFPQPPTVCISGTSQAKGGVSYSIPERIFFFPWTRPTSAMTYVNLCIYVLNYQFNKKVHFFVIFQLLPASFIWSFSLFVLERTLLSLWLVSLSQWLTFALQGFSRTQVKLTALLSHPPPGSPHTFPQHLGQSFPKLQKCQLLRGPGLAQASQKEKTSSSLMGLHLQHQNWAAWQKPKR